MTARRLVVGTASRVETQRWGARLGRLVRRGDLLGLVGPLGAGKTSFVQGLARGMGIGKEARVRSPAFAVANVYDGNPPLYHVDLYRLESFAALAALGYEEYYYGDGVCAVEWFDRCREAAEGADCLVIRFAVRGATRRTLAFEPLGQRGEELSQALRTVRARALAAAKGQ